MVVVVVDVSLARAIANERAERAAFSAAAIDSSCLRKLLMLICKKK